MNIRMEFDRIMGDNNRFAEIIDPILGIDEIVRNHPFQAQRERVVQANAQRDIREQAISWEQ